ncbi:MAG: ATPase [Candidatus Bipolaricaulota bacterium]|nr:ATPase [Candidatus Bipolaricaulota bacterium]MDW8126473.1 BadF/BadG/BcrA/BcrD ATPase family protein [Candidatus Bipolaricaulota bacterium]
MKFVLGVDAGASKTLALVAETSGCVRGFGRAGPGNHQTVGLENALFSVRKACEAALAQAEVRGPVELGVFGLAGADLPEDFARLMPAVEKLALAHRVRVENDTIVALRAGASRSWGVVVVCGTGFNAAGIAPDGRVFRLPALGWISGDWGGGMDIAREAIKSVARAWDGRGKSTRLTSLVLHALGVPSEEEMIRALYRGDIPEEKLLGLVPVVFEAACQGDSVAQSIILRLGEEVGLAATAVIKKLGLENMDVEVVLAGGVFKGKGPFLVDVVEKFVHRVAPQARIVLPKFAPVVGAVLLALEEVEGGIRLDVFERLEATIPRDLKG